MSLRLATSHDALILHCDAIQITCAMSAAQYRYASSSFHTSFLVALGLTALITFLVWLFSQLLGLRYYNTITLAAGVIFFAFCSAAMIKRYLTRAVVFAIRPDGLFDARHGRDAVPWDQIRMVGLLRREHDHLINVYLWQREAAIFSAELTPDLTIDLSPLDATAESVLLALRRYLDPERIILERHA